VLASNPDQDWVVVTDTLIEGVHFPADTRPEAIAWKALAVNLSDLAAMGATPAAFSLALTLPDNKNHQAWLARFALGLRRLAKRFQIPLIGGDTTRHHTLVLTVTAHGQVPAGQALRRSGAASGDLLAITGVIGDGGMGLASKSGQLSERRVMSAELKLNRPTPRVSFGSRILGLASAAIDVSDGFLADLMHLTQASRLGAEVQWEAIPFSNAVQAGFDGTETGWLKPITAGDDYELIVAFSPEKLAAMTQASKATQTPFQVIGKLVVSEQIVLNKEGRVWKRFGPDDVSVGYQHFHE
jgi:thiamine-monophosphate kinase